MPRNTSLDMAMKTAELSPQHRPKRTRPHLALEFKEANKDNESCQQLVRHLFPHLQKRVLFPKPRRKVK